MESRNQVADNLMAIPDDAEKRYIQIQQESLSKNQKFLKELSDKLTARKFEISTNAFKEIKELQRSNPNASAH